MALSVEIREEPSLNNFVFVGRISRHDFIELISQTDLARQVSEKIADKIATCLWDRIEPKILQAIEEGFRST